VLQILRHRPRRDLSDLKEDVPFAISWKWTAWIFSTSSWNSQGYRIQIPEEIIRTGQHGQQVKYLDPRMKDVKED